MIRALLRRFLPAPMPVIGAARPADAAELAALHRAAFHRGWSEMEFATLLREASVLGHCVRERGRVIGFVLSRIAADEAEILSVAVDPARRGAGLAARLLAAHLPHLAARGVKRLFLEVEDGNTAAQRLYRTAGFSQIGARPGYYSGGKAALVLSRNL